MGLDNDIGFRRYLEQSGNIYGIVRKVQKDARELATQYNDKILHSEAITHIINGTVPEHKCYYSNEYEAQYIREMFCYIEDTDVRNAVYDSFYESKRRNNLYYIYNNISDSGRKSRVRVLTRILWHNLLGFLSEEVQAMSEETNIIEQAEETKPKRRKRKAKALISAESAVEPTVETSAIPETDPPLPEITEDPVVEEQVCVPSTDSEIVIDDSSIVDVEPVVEVTPVEEAAPAEELPVEKIPAEVVKPKRTKKSTPKAKSENELPKYFDIDQPIWIYRTSINPKPMQAIRGRYWVWSPEIVTGRICVTESESGAGIISKIAGWVNVSDLKCGD